MLLFMLLTWVCHPLPTQVTSSWKEVSDSSCLGLAGASTPSRLGLAALLGPGLLDPMSGSKALGFGVQTQESWVYRCSQTQSSRVWRLKGTQGSCTQRCSQTQDFWVWRCNHTHLNSSQTSLILILLILKILSFAL